MTKCCYRFAGLEIELSASDTVILENESRLAQFAAKETGAEHRYHFRKVDSLTPPAGVFAGGQGNRRAYEDQGMSIRYIGTVQDTWEQAHIRTAHQGRCHEVQLLSRIHSGPVGLNVILESLGLEHLTIRNSSFLFHCSFIEVDGEAILFTAPSGTGKSTQADLWQKYRGTEIINGDRAAVRITEDGRILAEGVPFCGSSEHCKNRSLPLRAIVYLSQAPSTTIRRLRGYEAFFRIWEGITVNTWDRKDLELASETVRRVAERIPVYHMPCTPDEAAVIMLEQELKKRVNV